MKQNAENRELKLKSGFFSSKSKCWQRFIKPKFSLAHTTERPGLHKGDLRTGQNGGFLLSTAMTNHLFLSVGSSIPRSTTHSLSLPSASLSQILSTTKP